MGQFNLEKVNILLEIKVMEKIRFSQRICGTKLFLILSIFPAVDRHLADFRIKDKQMQPQGFCWPCS